MSRKILFLLVLASLILAACAPRGPNPAENFWCHTGPSDSNHWGEFNNLIPGLSGPTAMAKILQAFIEGDTTIVQVVKVLATKGSSVTAFLVHLKVGPAGTDALWIAEPGRQGTMYVPDDGETYINLKMNRPGLDVTGDPSVKGILDGEAQCRVETAPAPVPIPSPVPAILSAFGLLGLLGLFIGCRVRRQACASC